MTERDKILKTLRAIPGVKEESRQMDFTSFYNPETSNSVAVWKDGVIDSLHTTKATTLAEAVAALTPPAQPNPPTYDYVAGLKGVKAKKRAEYILFERQDGTQVEFSFGADGAMLSAFLGEEQLANPQTEDEVLATLRMCRVEGF